MITVTISKSRLDELGQDVHRGIFVLKQLRSAGVPVLGSIWPIGVNEGVLTMYTEGDAGLRYEWDGSELEDLA